MPLAAQEYLGVNVQILLESRLDSDRKVLEAELDSWLLRSRLSELTKDGLSQLRYIVFSREKVEQFSNVSKSGRRTPSAWIVYQEQSGPTWSLAVRDVSQPEFPSELSRLWKAHGSDLDAFADIEVLDVDRLRELARLLWLNKSCECEENEARVVQDFARNILTDPYTRLIFDAIHEGSVVFAAGLSGGEDKVVIGRIFNTGAASTPARVLYQERRREIREVLRILNGSTVPISLRLKSEIDPTGEVERFDLSDLEVEFFTNTEQGITVIPLSESFARDGSQRVICGAVSRDALGASGVQLQSTSGNFSLVTETSLRSSFRLAYPFPRLSISSMLTIPNELILGNGPKEADLRVIPYKKLPLDGLLFPRSPKEIQVRIDDLRLSTNHHRKADDWMFDTLSFILERGSRDGERIFGLNAARQREFADALGALNNQLDDFWREVTAISTWSDLELRLTCPRSEKMRERILDSQWKWRCEYAHSAIEARINRNFDEADSRRPFVTVMYKDVDDLHVLEYLELLGVYRLFGSGSGLETRREPGFQRLVWPGSGVVDPWDGCHQKQPSSTSATVK